MYVSITQCAPAHYFLSHKGIYKIDIIQTTNAEPQSIRDIVGQATIEFLQTSQGLVCNENWSFFVYYYPEEPTDEAEDISCDSDDSDSDYFCYNVISTINDQSFNFECQKTYPSRETMQVNGKGYFEDCDYYLNIQGLHNIQINQPQKIFSFAHICYLLHESRKNFPKPMTCLLFDPKFGYNFDANWDDDKSFTLYKANIMSYPLPENKSTHINHPLIPKQKPWVAQLNMFDYHSKMMTPQFDMSITFLKEGIITEMVCPCPGVDNVKIRLKLVRVEVYKV